MPRARQIKYGFFINEKLGELPPLCRILFEGLWLICDREGKLEDRPKKIQAQLLPFDHGADVGAYLDALQNAQFLRRYKIGAARFIKILNFNEHQNPHVNETASIIPEPVAQDSGASTVQEQDKNSLNPACIPVTCMLDIKKETKAKKKELRTKFEQFYAQYPRHKDHKRALAAFEKINPDDELFRAMMLAVKNQDTEYKFKNPDDSYKFFKHPAPWLNGRCWTDEVDLSGIEKEKRKKSPYTKCKMCGKEILRTLGLGGYCEKCFSKIYPKKEWMGDDVKVAHG